MSTKSGFVAMIQDAFRHIGSIPSVRKYTAIFLNNEQCTATIYDDNALDSECLSLALSKTMGYYSFLGAGKIIVINNILHKQSAVGLNPVSVYTEWSAYASNVYYNYVRGNDISTYGDYCAATLHNTVIIMLMWSWGIGDKQRQHQQSPKEGSNSNSSNRDGMLSALHICMALISAAAFGTAMALCPREYYGAILTYSIALNMGSKVPQIVHNFRTQRMGVQSQAAQGMALFAALMKLFIAHRETPDDPLLLFGCYSRVALNATLMVQGLMYSESEPQTANMSIGGRGDTVAARGGADTGGENSASSSAASPTTSTRKRKGATPKN